MKFKTSCNCNWNSRHPVTVASRLFFFALCTRRSARHFFWMRLPSPSFWQGAWRSARHFFCRTIQTLLVPKRLRSRCIRPTFCWSVAITWLRRWPRSLNPKFAELVCYALVVMLWSQWRTCMLQPCCAIQLCRWRWMRLRSTGLSCLRRHGATPPRLSRRRPSSVGWSDFVLGGARLSAVCTLRQFLVQCTCFSHSQWQGYQVRERRWPLTAIMDIISRTSWCNSAKQNQKRNREML